ncbi:uncharacterized protein A4U43_UnF10820 [Asparagus officinalis]|uniref:Integrase catalytic domain-containing protein n=1 Tax=Asparagus officinalis TaxID=4686 RepID=A0A1R3L5E9_ASPOF|nr:uncharacterized protein A4U43_UnF10820 [Asparagus officinalis]
MAEGASVAQHLNELNTVITQLSSVEIEFDEEVRALILLSSLPESWNATVTAVSSSSGSTKLKFDDVRDLVLSEEIRWRESGEATTSSVLHTESRGRNSTRENGRCKSNYRGRSKDRRSKSRNPSNNSKAIECWNYGKTGHYKNQYKSAQKEKEAKAEVNVTSTSGGDDALICSLESKEESWVLDSGASFHATSQKEFFEKYIPKNLGYVYLGDDQPCAIVGKGVVKIKLNGSVWELNDVRHIPDLRKNLISVGQLAGEGYTTTFHGDDWKISKGAMTIARCKKTNTLYMTTGARCLILVAAGNETSKLWYQRLGHMSEKGIKIMHTKEKLPGLQLVEMDMCEECILIKQKRVSFQTSSRTLRKEKLELIHSDVWGPTTITSIGGKHYFVTFIDDHSRKVSVYFLKHKSEVFEAFRKWKAMVENETGLRIKTLKTDNDGEYEDTGFKKFCYEHGIRIERTVPGTPQQNGVAERINQTLTERDRSIRVQNKLDPKSKKCTFIGYGKDEFGYCIWDNENKKVIKSRDVIFNEKVMYKDRRKTDDSENESTFIDADDVPSNLLEKPNTEGPQPEELVGQDGAQEPDAPAPILRRYSRPPVPNRRYMNYLLLTDGGEPESFDEAC